MLVLALDTTTRAGSAALVRNGEVLREERSAPDRPHATRLPADLMVLLARTDVRLEDIDLFAVGAGPGSFTGLRIGIAAMQRGSEADACGADDRRIRAAESDGAQRLHLVALTANAGREDEAAARAAGFDGFLAKPLNLKLLPPLLERQSARAA